MYGFIPALFILCFEILVNSKYLYKFHGIVALVINILVQIFAVYVTLLFVTILFGINRDFAEGSIEWYQILLQPGPQRGITTISIAIVLINFMNMLRTFLGKGIMYNLILGTYHTPREVERIFMFLDVKSSTTIAEKIGHVDFMLMLRDFFYLLSDAVVMHKGEIYKYVGDEAIVTWQMKNDLYNENFIHCFFTLQKMIEDKRKYFNSKHGVVPEFKVGVHSGPVVIGEIGHNKKEIAYLGDVINTAARVEGQCNEFDKDFLVTEDVFEKCKLPEEFKSLKIGEVQLRGKQQLTMLYFIEKG